MERNDNNIINPLKNKSKITWSLAKRNTFTKESTISKSDKNDNSDQIINKIDEINNEWKPHIAIGHAELLEKLEEAYQVIQSLFFSSIATIAH